MTAVLTPSTFTDRRTEPDQVHEVLARSILVDGFDFVLDLTRSAGSYLVDARDGRIRRRAVESHSVELQRASLGYL